MIWSLLHNPLFTLAAPGAAFVFAIPYALWGKDKR